MVELTDDDVLLILRLLKESEFEELSLEIRGLRVEASKAGTKPVVQADRPSPTSAERKAATEPDEAGSPQPPRDPALVPVTAPVVGVFYSAPEPGADPFVSPGAHVGPDTTVGLIEVMKMFNAVSAGVGGEIEQALVADGDFVEYQQPLFLVRPER